MKELFERAHAGVSFSKTATLSVTGHVLVLALVFMAASYPISAKKDLDRLPIIHATLVSVKGMPSLPQRSGADDVKREAPQLKAATPAPAAAPERKAAPPALSAVSQRPAEKSGGAFTMSLPAKASGSGSVGSAIASRTANSGGAGYAGAGVTSAVPRYRSNPQPPYPYPARTGGHEGLVILTAEVRVDGRVGALRLKRSSGYGSLDQSALATVRVWTFEPARRQGVAVASLVDIPVRFSLHTDYE